MRVSSALATLAASLVTGAIFTAHAAPALIAEGMSVAEARKLGLNPGTQPVLSISQFDQAGAFGVLGVPGVSAQTFLEFVGEPAVEPVSAPSLRTEGKLRPDAKPSLQTIDEPRFELSVLPGVNAADRFGDFDPDMPVIGQEDLPDGSLDIVGSGLALVSFDDPAGDLSGLLNPESPATDAPIPNPLPGAAWFLLAGLAGLGLARRRAR